MEIARLNMRAFPTGAVFNKDGLMIAGENGMELRDYFAGMAVQGLIAQFGCKSDRATAKFAYEIADAMMEARDEDN